ncbi:N-terminal EF-hand calcium-binding protein 1-like isoform X1 [Dysidea avara]|uniref:N-terminal EF-hand calcium-binding protein 1-like isoform X1 n=1 Tax=Dysidea avara TaxID=196820 RepID=UPI0033205531
MYTDSGSLSLKEFQQLFSDGIMTSEELQELFHLIDTEKTNTLSHSELLAYFQLYMADFEPIFSLTDDLSVAITNNLKSTHNKHQSTIKLEMVEEEEVTQDSKNTIVVVHMFLEASESNVSAFRQSLKNYVQSVTNESGCLHVCVQSNVGSYSFSVYEVWQDSGHLSIPYRSWFKIFWYWDCFCHHCDIFLCTTTSSSLGCCSILLTHFMIPAMGEVLWIQDVSYEQRKCQLSSNDGRELQ